MISNLCGCGRSSRHRGRCMARRHPKAGLMTGDPDNTPVPVMADPLGKAVAVSPASVDLNQCTRCGGPKGRSPYAVCHGCMGRESMKAEAAMVSKIPGGILSHDGRNTPSLAG